MTNIDEDTFYIYQHVPKCGGKAFRNACRSYMNLVLEKPPKKTDEAAWEEFVRSKVDFSTIPDGTMICGHLIHEGVRPRERYADEIAVGNVRIVTVLRDPLERAISAYFFRQKQGKQTEARVEGHLRNMRNPISHHLGWQEGSARDFLDSYFFVGVTEYLNASVELLCKLIDKPPVEVPINNVTPRKPYEIPQAEIDSFMSRNIRDYDLYNEAVKLLGERFEKEIGRPLPPPVRRVVADQ